MQKTIFCAYIENNMAQITIYTQQNLQKDKKATKKKNDGKQEQNNCLRIE